MAPFELVGICRLRLLAEFAACGAGAYFPKGGCWKRSEMVEAPPGRAARGSVVLSHTLQVWQIRLGSKDREHLSFMDATVLLLSRYPQRNW